MTTPPDPAARAGAQPDPAEADGAGDGADGAGDGDGDGKDEGPLYAKVDGVVWRPLYSHQQAAKLAGRFIRRGVWAGAVVLVVGGAVAVFRDGSAELLPLAVAAAAGVVLVLVGIGLLVGETLHAVTEEVEVRGPGAGRPGGRALAGGAGWTAVTTGLSDGIKGLTPGRALVFAGTLLLIGLAVGGGLAAGGEEGGDGSSGTPSAPASTAPSPASSGDG